MLVRLLQRFSTITLRQDAHPASVPPPGVERSPYAVNGLERVWMRSHLTAYAKVSIWLLVGRRVLICVLAERAVGRDGGGGDRVGGGRRVEAVPDVTDMYDGCIVYIRCVSRAYHAFAS